MARSSAPASCPVPSILGSCGLTFKTRSRGHGESSIQYIDLPSDDEIVADLRALLAVDAIPEYAKTARQWAELAGVKERPMANVLRALVEQGKWLSHTRNDGQARTFVYWPIKKDEQRE